MDITELLAEREIYRGLVQFARAMDERDWQLIEGLTTEDITFRTLGRYRDRWRKVDGRWLMCERVKENRATVGSLAVFGFGQGT